MKKSNNLAEGNVTKVLLAFAGPMILGNLLQQFYNIVDTWVVGRFVGADALAAAGSAYTLMTFLTSILIGLCMGSGALLSFYYGSGEHEKMRDSMHAAFELTGIIAFVLFALVRIFTEPILSFLRIPSELRFMMREYVVIVFWGIFFVFLYNFYAFLLRAVGNSVIPLAALGIASILNIVLDLIFVVGLGYGMRGAAWATVIAQGVSGILLVCYVRIKLPDFRLSRNGFASGKRYVGEILRYSVTTSAQQSVMNFGILLVQGLVNSFGAEVMAAFAAAVKIDTFAYMPAQEFGNAYSIFVSQNYGAGKPERLKQGTKRAFLMSTVFCAAISGIVFCLAKYLMMIFVDGSETEIIRIGIEYLRTEGAFYMGIGILFLLYGYFRGIGKPGVSLVLTVVSLGTRVILAYGLAAIPAVGVLGIWWAIPVGWALADLTGVLFIRQK